MDGRPRPAVSGWRVSLVIPAYNEAEGIGQAAIGSAIGMELQNRPPGPMQTDRLVNLIEHERAGPRIVPEVTGHGRARIDAAGQ